MESAVSMIRPPGTFAYGRPRLAFRTVLSRFTMSSETHRTDGASQCPCAAFHPLAAASGTFWYRWPQSGQTVSSHTSQGTRRRPVVPLGRLRRRWGGRPGRPERGRLLMAGAAWGGEADQIAGFLGIAGGA